MPKVAAKYFLQVENAEVKWYDEVCSHWSEFHPLWSMKMVALIQLFTQSHKGVQKIKARVSANKALTPSKRLCEMAALKLYYHQ